MYNVQCTSPKCSVTRRALSPYTLYSDRALLVLNRTLLNCDNGLLPLNWRYKLHYTHKDGDRSSGKWHTTKPEVDFVVAGGGARPDDVEGAIGVLDHLHVGDLLAVGADDRARDTTLAGIPGVDFDHGLLLNDHGLGDRFFCKGEKKTGFTNCLYNS